MPIKTKIAKEIQEQITSYLENKGLLDNLINLSNEDKENKLCLSAEKVKDDEGYMTLLSEGAILYADGSIRDYIVKGTLKEFYDSIDDTFEGYVTTGHVSTSSFPVREGYFRKEDLKLLKDENGRYDLLVKPHVNLELSSVKDLIIQDEPFAISSEFYFENLEMNEENQKEFSKLIEYDTLKGGFGFVSVINKVDILGFSFVGNPGNAKSGGYEPSLLIRNEKERMTNKEKLENILNKLSTGENEVEVEPKETVAPTEAPVAETPKEDSDVADLLAQANEAIVKLTEQLEKANKEIEEKEAKLSEYANEEEKVSKQVEQLTALLSSTNFNVVEPKKEAKEEKVNVFGRKRLGGAK